MSKVAIYCIDFFPSEGGYSFAFQNLIRGLVTSYDNLTVDVFTPVQLNSIEEMKVERVNIYRFKIGLIIFQFI
jgi:hypothetical protein